MPFGRGRSGSAATAAAGAVDAGDRLSLGERVAILGIIFYCLFPFYWLVKQSVEKTGQTGILLPGSFSLTHYRAAFTNGDFVGSFMTSIMISGAATAIALLVGGLAGYALARLDVPFKQYILFVVLAVSMFPGISVVGPLFDLWIKLGLFDTKTGLVIPNVTFSLPIAIWIMSSFFRDLPRDLEQAAYVDGATPLQAFRKVMLPLAAPGVFTAAILVFIGSWNEFMFAAAFSAENAKTVPIAIATFQGAEAYEIPIGAISAASVVCMLPLVVMVMIFQKRIVGGLTAGGVKG